MTETLCLFGCIGPFFFCTISELGCLNFTLVAFNVISRLCLSFTGVLWTPILVMNKMGHLAPTTWEFQTLDIKTPVFIIGKLSLWKGGLSDNYIQFFFCYFDWNILSFQMYWTFSVFCDMEIGLYDIHLDVIFVSSPFSLSVFGVLRRPRFGGGSCKLSYLAPTIWEFQALDRKTPVSIICENSL